MKFLLWNFTDFFVYFTSIDLFLLINSIHIIAHSYYIPAMQC